MSLHSLAVTLAIVLAFATKVPADPLLHNDDNTLTTSFIGIRTPVQGVFPGIHDRGVGLGGYERIPANFGLHIAADPSADAWNERDMFGAIRLSTGTYVVSETDLAFPSPGFAWQISRSYSARQVADLGTRDSNGYQGKNWFQNSQPELVFHDADGMAGTKELDDRIYLIYRADAFIEFARVADGSAQPSDTFRAINGAAGAMLYEAGTGGDPDTYTYYDARGATAVFFGGNTASGKADWQLWKVASPGGHVAYVGHKTSPTTAVTDGYDAAGRISTVYDTADRRITYAYATYGGVQRLELVVYEVNQDSGATWVTTTDIFEIGRVEYGYIDSDNESHGSAGDLKYVKVSNATTHTDPDAAPMIHWTYYRYYEEDFSVSGKGHKHLLKMVLAPHDAQRFDREESGMGEPEVDQGWETATDAELKPFATRYFEYEDDDPGSGKLRRIVSAYTDGQCGCSGKPSTTYGFVYEANGSYTDTLGYDTAWAHRTVTQQPGGGYQTDYFDEAGQPISTAYTDADPAVSFTEWHGAKVVRDSNGYVIALHEANNVVGYTHSSGAFTTSSSDGLIMHRERITSGASDFFGLVDEYRYQIGDNGSSTKYLLRSKTFHDAGSEATLTVGEVDIRRTFPSSIRIYREQSTAITDPADETLYDYAFFPVGVGDPDAPLMPRQIEVQHPTISEAEHGSGDPVTEAFWHLADGPMQWHRTPGGQYEYWEREYGQVVAFIQDANPADSSRFPTSGAGAIDAPTDDVSSSNTVPAVSLATMCEWKYYYDHQRFQWLTEDPEGRFSCRKVWESSAGGKLMVSIPRVEVTGTLGSYEVSKSYGPVLYEMWGCLAISRTGETRRVQKYFDSQIVFEGGSTTASPEDWVTTPVFVTGGLILYPEADPILAFTDTYPSSTYADAWLRNVVEYIPYAEAPEEIRTYWKTPDNIRDYTELADHTFFEYDGQHGKLSKVISADNSYTRFEYDIGDEEVVGTYRGGVGQTETHTLEETFVLSYFGDRLLLVSRTEKLGSSGSDRETTYFRDDMGRLVAQVNPEGPHRVYSYDEQGGISAWADYSDASGLDAESLPSDTYNRIAYSLNFAPKLVSTDPTVPPVKPLQPRPYEERRYKIDSSGQVVGAGTSSPVFVSQQYWFDTEGRIAKSVGDTIWKYQYDRMGRLVREYQVAATGDADYVEALSVSSDIVLEEKQIYYDGCVLPAIGRVTIQRRHDDFGTGETEGALDDNGDMDATQLSIAADVEGRVQIEAYWYDEVDRLRKVARYGDNGGSNFDWDSVSEPMSSSSSVLVTETEYSWVKHIYRIDQVDERGVVSRAHYDDADRVVARIDDRIDDTPSGPTATDDRTVRYGYEDGNLVTIWTDVEGNDTSGTDPYGTADPGHVDDQITRLVYGVTTSSSLVSELNDPSLLYEIQHPDSSGGTDVERFAYNRQGELIERKDQVGHTFSITLDDLGRQVAIAVDETISGFDYTVRRIEWAYGGRGVLEGVLQRGTADTSGAVLDEVRIETDGWNQLATMHHDLNSAYTAMGDHLTVDFGFEDVAGERRITRRSGMDYPSGLDVNYSYSSSGGSQDNEIGRPSKISLGSLGVAMYEYMGAARLASVNYPEPQVASEIYSHSTGAYDYVDRWDRPSRTRWRRTPNSAAAAIFYDISTAFDAASRVESIDDNVFVDPTVATVGHDFLYSNDNLGRLLSAEHGLLTSGSLSRTDGSEVWTLKHSAQWATHNLDLDGDGNFNLSGEFIGVYDHTNANELIERVLTTSGTPTTYTLTYDANGNLTDDAQDYEYTYDAFGRLVEVADQSQDVVNSYQYNGLGHRIREHYDIDMDGTIDADEQVEYVYDDQWRVICAYSSTGSTRSLREQFVYHFAGLDGTAGYVDSIVLRALPGTGQQQAAGTDRLYYCQNWRADVVALVNADGSQAEQVRYSAYGTPFNLPLGDVDSDGTTQITDFTQVGNWSGSSTYDVRGDLDLDGDVDSADQALVYGGLGVAGGRGVLSTQALPGAHGYTGHIHDQAVSSMAHSRSRALTLSTGKFLQRDPVHNVLMHLSQLNAYAYAGHAPLFANEPYGLFSITSVIGSSGIQSRLKGIQAGRIGQVSRELIGMLNKLNKFLEGAQSLYSCVESIGSEVIQGWISGEISSGDFLKEVLCRSGQDCIAAAVGWLIGLGGGPAGVVESGINCIASALLPFRKVLCGYGSVCAGLLFGMVDAVIDCVVGLGVEAYKIQPIQSTLLGLLKDAGVDFVSTAACSPPSTGVD